MVVTLCESRKLSRLKMGWDGGRDKDRGTYLLFLFLLAFQVSRCIILGNGIASDGSAFSGLAICTHSTNLLSAFTEEGQDGGRVRTGV